MQNDQESQWQSAEPAKEANKNEKGGLGLFVLGLVLGAIITASAMTLRSGAPATSASTAIDAATLREAARQGAATAIAEQQQDALAEGSIGNSTNTTGTNNAKVLGPEKPPTDGTLQNVALRPANVMGAANAPITIVEYSDFNCGYCLRFHQQTYPALIDLYVKTGKAKFAYKQFAILGPDSVSAAQASECAADQNKFWEYHDLVFTKRLAGQGLSVDSLIAYAGEMKLDTAKFTACLQNNQTADRIQADLNEAQQAGFRGTPTFVINGKVLVGAQPLQVFQQELDRLLAAKQ
jgi:protein-disulfide isomerase